MIPQSATHTVTLWPLQAERLSDKILNEVSRIKQKTVADECDDVTIHSGLVQLTLTFAVRKYNVRSKNKQNETMHSANCKIVEYTVSQMVHL